MSAARLDWGDPVAVSHWLAGLRLAWNDADAVALDMLRPKRERDLGVAKAGELYSAAREQILSAIEYATASEPDAPAN